MASSAHANISVPDSAGWVKVPFLVELGDTQAEYFNNVKEMLAYALDHKIKRGAYNPGDLIKKLTATGDEAPLPEISNSPLLVDTRLGWNDALNPLWQFAKDDDIMYPIHMTDNYHGMGRVYQDTIEKHQRVLYISFGVPEFSGLIDFYMKAIDTKVANLMRNGTGDLVSEISSLVGSAVGFGIKAPFMPFIWLKRLAEIRRYRITKYYDFKSTMPLYYTAVTGMLSKLAVNMGFITGFDIDFEDGKEPPVASKNSLPILMQINAPDMWKIVSQRAQSRMAYNNALNKTLGTTSADLLNKFQQRDDELAEKHTKIYGRDTDDDSTNESWWGIAGRTFAQGRERFFETFFQTAGETALGGLNYIGFRIDKNADASESFSNSTGEASIASKLNSKATDARDTLFSMAHGKLGLGPVDTALKAVTGFFSEVASSFNMDSLINNYTGHSYYDIPEVWQNSSFGKSYSFNFQLRAPYGDPISVFQSIYVPMCCILAGTLPRATGTNSFTSPFLLRAYCKGMFAVPLGIIESLSITRGSSEFGWNLSSLPTQVDISISIKDLSPAMYYGIGTGTPGNILNELFSQNSAFNEYMMTLSGMGLAERILFMNNITRRLELLFTSVRNTWGNPHWWGAKLGESTLGQLTGVFVPMDALPRN